MQKAELSISDGFKFGCGFFVAWILGSVILSILVAIAIFVLTLIMPGLIGGMGFPPSIGP